MYCGSDTSSIKQRFCKGELKYLKIPHRFCPEWFLNNNELSCKLMQQLRIRHEIEDYVSTGIVLDLKCYLCNCSQKLPLAVRKRDLGLAFELCLDLQTLKRIVGSTFRVARLVH